MQIELLHPDLQDRLPSPRGVALAIGEACRNSSLQSAQLINLLQTDARLCERLQNYVRSTSDGEVTASGIHRLVSLLEFTTVRQLALIYSLVDQHQAGPCVGFAYDAYWSQALLMGIAMRELGAALSLPDGDALFCAGVLASAGRLALACAYPTQYGKITATGARGERLLKLEQKFLKIDHLRLSAMLLTQWGVASEYVQGLLFQEDLAQTTTVVHSRAWQLGQVMQIAHQLAELSTLSAREQESRTSSLIELANRLGLDAMELGACVDRSVATWHSMGASLNITTLAIPDFETLVAENVRSDKEVNSAWLRVLIVDDDPIALHVVEEWLRNACGYTVKVAANGADALALAEGYLPHVVLTDWRMPVVDGLELCAILRSSDWGKSIYVIMLTSAELESDLVQAFNAGVDDYLNGSSSISL